MRKGESSLSSMAGKLAIFHIVFWVVIAIWENLYAEQLALCLARHPVVAFAVVLLFRLPFLVFWRAPIENTTNVFVLSLIVGINAIAWGYCVSWAIGATEKLIRRFNRGKNLP